MQQHPITSQVAQPHRTATPSEEALAKVFWSALTTSNGDSVTNQACAHAYRTVQFSSINSQPIRPSALESSRRTRPAHTRTALEYQSITLRQYRRLGLGLRVWGVV